MLSSHIAMAMQNRLKTHAMIVLRNSSTFRALVNIDRQADKAADSGMLIKSSTISDRSATASGACASEARMVKALMANLT